MDSDLVTRMRLQHVRSFFSNKLIAGMESKPCKKSVLWHQANQWENGLYFRQNDHIQN